jgi:hypothetical protein
LAETSEEPAWAGLRWRIRIRTFAHVLIVDPDHERSYAAVARRAARRWRGERRGGGAESRAAVARRAARRAARSPPWCKR